MRPELELKPFDWADLEARFGAQMEACDGEEERVGKEFDEWVEVCVFLFLVVCGSARGTYFALPEVL